MVPIIPSQRNHLTNSAKPFDDLNKYVEGEIAKEREMAKAQGQGGPQLELSWVPETSKFDELLKYTTAKVDKDTKAEKCIAIMTNGVHDISSASAEMNAVAAKNTRVKAPAYHFILSWPEHEKPEPKAVFDAAVHAIEALGLGQHQYIIAIHGNTDNMHAHISVNRVHPITFKSRNIEWAKKTLHKAARESEIKHDWTHDNGLWIVEKDGHGKKHVVINPEYNSAFDSTSHAHAELGTEDLLPTWHDPDSLESWLKTKISKALRKDLKHLDSWGALHSWLGQYNLTLKDSGGGGMQIQGAAPDTGEIFTIASSKGLRDLKRGELEKRWGIFNQGIEVPCQVTDLSNLTTDQIQKGITNVINRTTTLAGGDPYGNTRPPEHILRAQQHRPEHETEGSSGVHELPVGRVDGEGQDGASVLQNPFSGGVGNTHTRQDQDVRRPGTSQTSSSRSLNRDDGQREERKLQRALARADLRSRYAQYKRFVLAGEIAHTLRTKAIKIEKTKQLSELRKREHEARKAVTKSGLSPSLKLHEFIDIDTRTVLGKLEIEATYQARMKELKITRQPPLGWRVWLFEQSNLGDKAAISALRGIVYQENRDAKKGQGTSELEIAEADQTEESNYRKALARLLKQEKRETAIRAANQYAMRPYEADVLLQKYRGIQSNITGNGNIEYRGITGVHLFTDRGNRVTFDKDRVTDDEIRLALAHAQQKFGNKLMLTGDDPVFTARMARLADDMGLTVLNPELRPTIEQHRAQRDDQIEAGTLRGNPVNTEDMLIKQPTESKPEELVQIEPVEHTTTEQLLRAIVLSIDPLATFEQADTSESQATYIGMVAAQSAQGQTGFIQHQGKGHYIIHNFPAPELDNDSVIEIAYRGHDRVPSITIHEKGADKTR
jgi:hypothetical protein